MGQDKARLLLGGKSLLDWVIEALQPVCTPLVLVAGDKSKYSDSGLPILEDMFPGAGPLGGIYTALKSLASPGVLIATCDQPFLTPECLKPLLTPFRAKLMACYSTQEGIQPFPGHYRQACLPLLVKDLEQGHLSVRQWVSKNLTSAELFPVSTSISRCFFNINTPAELQTAERILLHS